MYKKVTSHNRSSIRIAFSETIHFNQALSQLDRVRV